MANGPEATDWLKPLLDEARKWDIDLAPLIYQSAVPDDDGPAARFFGSRQHRTDWIWVGYQLRELLGWETYPDCPGAWDMPL
ncbi:hypothetical protein [Mycobacterium sp.]|uniref:hypothetical protein n=1 Tax=Mycobacterium sp. TaxID=1785 RepID=UPI003F96C709